MHYLEEVLPANLQKLGLNAFINLDNPEMAFKTHAMLNLAPHYTTLFSSTMWAKSTWKLLDKSVCVNTDSHREYKEPTGSQME